VAFEVHRAERSDVLAEGLAELLRDPLPDPFARELVIVPARGVERWLSQRLSHRLGPTPGRDDGVCAGVDFRTPTSLVAEILGTRDADPWAPQTLMWPLLRTIDAVMAEPWAAVLAAHLGHDVPGEEGELRRGRRLAVSRRLAGLFSSYAVQRPALLADWEAGRDTDGTSVDVARGELDQDLRWQPELWRRLVAQVGEPSPVQRHAAVLAHLRAAPDDLDLPTRISLFGHTRIAPTEIELLEALGEAREVHLWLPHPSPALWDALVDLRGPVPRTDDESHLRVGHPLLVSLGRDLRELQRLLPTSTATTQTATNEATTLLAQLQADIAANTLPPEPRPLDPGDDSITVHSCHGPARQVEVLREVLVGLLADDPTLEPRDILVMCPDIEAYAPLVAAAFGLGDVAALQAGESHPGQHLRVRLADRALTQTNPLLAVAMQLLDLAGGRAEASTVLDLLTLEPVRRRFGFTHDHLERIAHWVSLAGVRWAFDAAHREQYSLSAIVQNTWQFGLDRILAGAAVSEHAGRWFGTTLPLDDVSSTDIDLAGRLAECLDRLQRTTDALTGVHPVEHWVGTMSEAINALTLVGRGEEWQSGQALRELAAVAAAATDGADGTLLRRNDVRALLEERFGGRPTRANFRTGSLTVATLTPMRSVPHRVVCLLGIDDGVFPRAGAVDGDDVLARRPLTGERDLRSEDRQLMLDAVLSATERLVVTYTGANESTGRRRPPAVPLKELLDSLDRTACGAADHVVRRAPLQSFDPANFRPPHPFSFDTAALAGARAALADRVPTERLADLALAPPGGDLDLALLATFLCKPVSHFLRHRLEVALLDESEPESDAIPVELSHLESWAVGDRMLGDLRAGRDREAARDLEWRRGLLPPGQLGWDAARRIADEAAPIADLVDAFTAGAPVRAVDVDVALGGGRHLVGTVSDVYDRRVVRAGYSRLGPRHFLETWLAIVALEAAHPGRGWSAGAVGRGGRGEPPARVTFAAPADALTRLRELVSLYDAGMSGPVPLPLKTAHAWAARSARGSEAACRYAADKEWTNRGSTFGGERDEPAHRLVWGDHAPIDVLIDSGLPDLATRLWTPVLEAGVRR
jgi:exodeoxyribonuclease V gamma subunit